MNSLVHPSQAAPPSITNYVPPFGADGYGRQEPDARVQIARALMENTPFIALIGTGEQGAGPLLRDIAGELPLRCHIAVANAFSETLNLPSLLERVLDRKPGSFEGDRESAFDALMEGASGGIRRILLIDRADCAPQDVLAHLALLTTLLGTSVPLLQIVLSGTANLLALCSPEIARRIGVTVALKPEGEVSETARADTSGAVSQVEPNLDEEIKKLTALYGPGATPLEPARGRRFVSRRIVGLACLTVIAVGVAAGYRNLTYFRLGTPKAAAPEPYVVPPSPLPAPAPALRDPAPADAPSAVMDADPPKPPPISPPAESIEPALPSEAKEPTGAPAPPSPPNAVAERAESTPATPVAGSPNTPVTGNTAANQPAAPSLAALNALIRRGDAYVAGGDIVAARLLYERAAPYSAAAARAAGQTYDPFEIAKLGIRGVQPDGDAAVAWYRRARDMGDPAAAGLLDRLVSHPG